MHPSVVRAGALAALASFVLSGCSGNSSAATPTEPDLVSIGVQVVQVQRGDIISVIKTVGTLQTVQEAAISSRVPGRIVAFPFEVGDRVAAGALLVSLEPQEFQLAVQQAEAAVGLAQARLEGARRVHKRMNELRAQNITSTEREDAVATELAIGQARVREARAALNIAKDQLAQSAITAPFAGDVAQTFAHVGERISPGQPLLHVVNLDTVEVDVTISEKRIVDVQLDQAVRVRVDGFPTEEFLGTVRRLSPTVDPASRTFIATAQLANPERRLRPGMFSRVEIQVGARQNALVVTREGLLEETGEFFAVRVRDNRAERVQVTTGYRYGNFVEVRGGLELGDRVVTEGAYGLANGAAVHIVADG